MAVTSDNWMEFIGTGGNPLPATAIQFKVPVVDFEITPDDNPQATQIGYTITGTTAAVAPITLASGVGSIIRSVTITKGTWLLSAICNAEAIGGAIDLTNFLVGFAGLGVVTKSGSELAGTGIVAGDFYGTSLSYVIQVATPTTVDLDVLAVFNAAGGATFVISQVDNTSIRFTATRLS